MIQVNNMKPTQEELIDFIEMIEAITTDNITASSIRAFLETHNIWEKIN